VASDDIDNRFTYHPPSSVKVHLHEHVRDTLKRVAQDFDAVLPEGREKSLALTKLEEAMFWANASIARTPEEDN
jgi:hypothetical protein